MAKNIVFNDGDNLSLPVASCTVSAYCGGTASPGRTGGFRKTKSLYRRRMGPTKLRALVTRTRRL